MKVSYLFVLFFLAIFSSKAQGSTLFDLFLGNTQGGQRSGYNRRPKTRSYPSGGGYGDFRRICKVVNPDPYAFIGSNPYPGAPFCPP